MCFLPNRRASIDQAPGPIIAKAAAKIACARVTHGSPECEENSEIAIHTLAAAPSQRGEHAHQQKYRGRDADHLQSDG
jgi:hypothetical protein